MDTPLPNQKPVEYWQQRTYTENDIGNLLQRLEHALCMCVTVNPGKQLAIRVSKRVAETKQGHAPAVMQLMRWVLTTWGDEHPTGSIVFCLEDGQTEAKLGMVAPLFGFTKRRDDMSTLLMPDPAFLTTDGYSLERGEIDYIESRQDWSEKISTAFWRGSSSGLGCEDWREAPRARLVLASERFHDKAKFDAKFTLAISYPHNNSAEEITKAGLLVNSIPFKEFLQYRYLFDVDGESCAWRSFFLKLCSHSVVLKVESEYLQWYYGLLEPMKHYVPIRADMSDLELRLSWLKDHDAEACAIAKSAATLMKNISFKSEIGPFASVVSEILRRHREV